MVSWVGGIRKSIAGRSRGDPNLSSLDEASPGALGLALGSSVQVKHGTPRVDPEKGNKDD